MHDLSHVTDGKQTWSTFCMYSLVNKINDMTQL